MSWRVYSKTYSGNTPESLPEIKISENQNLVTIYRPWGTKQYSPQSIAALHEYWHLAHQDSDATSPFPRLPQFSKNANNLRLSLKICGDQLYRTANQEEYKEGLEMLLFSLENSELTFAQVGQLNFFAIDKDKIVPLALAEQSVSSSQAPIPLRLLGLDQNFEPDIKTTLIGNHKSFLIIAGNAIDLSKILCHQPANQSLEQLVDDLQNELALLNKNQSFWISAFEFES